MLGYFLAMLSGKRGLAAILSVLESTRTRLDAFVEAQEIRERDIRVRVHHLRAEGESIEHERIRAETVHNNLTKVLGLESE